MATTIYRIWRALKGVELTLREIVREKMIRGAAKRGCFAEELFPNSSVLLAT